MPAFNLHTSICTEGRVSWESVYLVDMLLFNQLEMGTACSIVWAQHINGDESLGTSLRLLAVLHAVQHFSHYVEVVSYYMLLSWHFITAIVADSQFSSQLEDPGMAVQFLASVSTDEAFQNRPKLKPTKEELVCYTLQQEIMQTSKLNSFSGFYLYFRSYISPYTGINSINTSNADTGWLQVQFLAGSLQRPIYQISEEQHLPLYNMPLFPCSCCKDITRDPIMIMWLRMKEPDADNPNPAINHIAPLVPLSGILHTRVLECGGMVYLGALGVWQ